MNDLVKLYFFILNVQFGSVVRALVHASLTSWGQGLNPLCGVKTTFRTMNIVKLSWARLYYNWISYKGVGVLVDRLKLIKTGPN